MTFAYSELSFVCPISHAPLGTATRLITGTHVGLNLGEVLRGDRITLSDYKLRMGQYTPTTKLCDVKVGRRQIEQAWDLIGADYRAEWIIDNLPGATSLAITTGDGNTEKYNARGFSIGRKGVDTKDAHPEYFLNNHFTIVIRYRGAQGEVGELGGKVIVGFEVFPKSISAAGRGKDGLPKDTENPRQPFSLALPPPEKGGEAAEDATITIPYTYSVIYKEDNTIQWENRWDRYMVPQDSSQGIHWLAIINSLVIAGLLAAVTAVILARTIQGDIKSAREQGKIGGKGGLLDPMDRRSRAEMDEEADEEVTGWKLVHSDVFRAPTVGGLLASIVGSGIQLAFMTSGLLILSCLGVLNPSYRGGFASIGAGLFVLGGGLSGYFAARIYKTFGGQMWKSNALLTASMVPGVIFLIILTLNLFAWSQLSSTALPFTTILALFALWFFVQLPCAFIGAYIGYVRRGGYSQPIKPAAIARQIPRRPWWAGSFISIVLAGSIPFAAVYIELVFMLKSVWLDKSSYYYLFGFASAVFVILTVTIMELTVMSTYLLLCYEVRAAATIIWDRSLTFDRTTAGIGIHSLRQHRRRSGSLHTAPTTTLPGLTSTASFRQSCSLATVRLAAHCMH